MEKLTGEQREKFFKKIESLIASGRYVISVTQSSDMIIPRATNGKKYVLRLEPKNKTVDTIVIETSERPARKLKALNYVFKGIRANGDPEYPDFSGALVYSAKVKVGGKTIINEKVEVKEQQYGITETEHFWSTLQNIVEDLMETDKETGSLYKEASKRVDLAQRDVVNSGGKLKKYLKATTELRKANRAKQAAMKKTENLDLKKFLDVKPKTK